MFQASAKLNYEHFMGNVATFDEHIWSIVFIKKTNNRSFRNVLHLGSAAAFPNL